MRQSGSLIREFLENEIAPMSNRIVFRGLGLIWGIDLSNCGGPGFAERVSARAFELGLIVEAVGREDSVLKIMPPLTIDSDLLLEGCAILKRAVSEVMMEEAAELESVPELAGAI